MLTLIIDMGCGTNPYKEHVNNVIGLDVGNYPEADINLSVQEVRDLNIFQKQLCRCSISIRLNKLW